MSMTASFTQLAQSATLEDRMGVSGRQRDLEDLAVALAETPRRIPSRFFYDDRGSRLFDRITQLPEYYPTRAEAGLLDRVAGELARLTPASELVELGAGTATKTRRLLEAFRGAGCLRRFVPVDVSAAELERAARALVLEFPGLVIHAIVTDFTADELDHLGGADALVLFLGSTIGNFDRGDAIALLSRIAAAMEPGAFFLLGADLVKSRARLEAAYNDEAGITAEFNRNILRVVNELADGDFEPDAFSHRAFYDEDKARIEMRLVAERDQTVALEALGLELTIRREESLLTEISCKYDRSGIEQMLRRAGFAPRGWFEEPGTFGLALAERP